MKKVLGFIVVFVIIFALSLSVSAQPNAIIKFDSNDKLFINVKGTADALSEGCAYVMKESMTDDALNLDNMSAGLLDFKSFTTDEEGSFDISFYMDGHSCPKGNYNVYISYVENEVYKKVCAPKLRYVVSGERATMLGSINTAIVNGTLKEYIINHKDDMLTDRSISDSFVEVDAISNEVTEMLSSNAPYTSYKGFVDDFNKFGAFSHIKNATATELESIIPSYRYYMNYEAEAYEKLAQYKTEACVLLASRDFSDINTMCDEISQAIYVIAAQNCTRWGELQEVLFTTYKEVYGLQSSAYAGLNESKVFGELLDLRPFTSVNDISDKFSAAIAKAKPETSKSTSGGGASGSSFGKYVQQTPTEQPQKQMMFADISQVPWAEKYIEALALKEIVTGMGDGNFVPHKAVSRAEFSVMLTKTMGINTLGLTAEYEDVAQGSWSYPYIAALTAENIASGAGGKFNPSNNITRQDIAVLIFRAIKNRGIIIEEKKEGIPSDYDDVAAYAKESVANLYKMGIVTGFEDNSFRPTQTATRAEAVVILYGLLDIL